MKPSQKRRRRSVSNVTNYETLEARQLLAADILTFVGDGQNVESSNVELSSSTGEKDGSLANGTAAAQNAVTASDRFMALEDHIRGVNTMTVAQLQSWANAFANEASSLGNRLDDFVAAVEVVELYEANVGPLFTSDGVSNFNNSWTGDVNVGRGLARAMLTVYQAVFDAFDNDLVSQNPALVEGTFFRSTENFPGSVPNPTDPNTVYQVQIDGTLNEEFGYVGGYSTNAARRFTGAYLSPGTIATIVVPDELVNAGYQVRVGGHSWDLSNKNNVNRLFRVSNLFDITDNVVEVANPMGGNIYIEVPVGADAGIVDVQFRNTIRAPFFSNRSFDQTTQSEWNVERTHPGAFTDIESEHSLFTVPTKWITNLGYDNLIEIIEAYDANIQVATEYAGKNPTRHKASLYAIVDTQIRGNAFSIGYPQSNYGTFSQNTIRAPLTLDNAFDKVLWHEHGHSEFLTMFAGETESLVHMAAFYIGVENYGFTIQEAFANSLAYGSTRHTTSDALNSWVVMDEFLEGRNMAFQQGSYRPRGHADYVEYVELFGLEALQNFNRRLNIEFDGTNLSDSFDEGGRTSHNYNDRILRLSREAGVNVAPLFHLWGHAPSNQSQLNAALAAEGLGDSVEIYDRMIAARDSVPLTQAEWNAVDSVMRDFLNNNRGPWVELRDSYDVDRGQAAVDRIQVLINTYFPNGRPAEAAAVVPIASKVIAFSEPNYQGESWELDEGLYQIAELNAGPIGNDNISSILIPEGFEIRIAQWQSNGGTRAVYTESVAQLGTLENDVSRVQVTFTVDDQQNIGESETIQVDNQWTTVTLKQSYNDPVVIAGTPSFEGTDPSTVRIRNVTSNSFEIQIDEWDYLNPVHSPEVVSYMVLEAGQYTLADGTSIVAGNQTGQNQNWQTYNLGSAFNGLGTPVVLTSVVTDADPTAVTTRVRVNSESQFEVRLQEEDSADGIHGAETVSFFAVQAGAGATGGLYYDSGTFLAGDSGHFESFDPAVRLSSVSSFFAGMQTTLGLDATTLRNTVLNASGVNVFTEEERSVDTEVGHRDETIGFFAIERGVITGAVVEQQIVQTAGQYVFYNNSGFDDTSDLASIAVDKVALRDGETATFANYTSFVHGINGIAVDLINPTTPTSSDFQLKFGNADDVDSWTTLDSSSAITNLTTVAGAGVNGSDRVFIEFADGAFTNGWLQLTVLGNSATGLTSDEAFYFGNVIGESGNDANNAIVNLADVSSARTNQTGFGLTDVLNSYDFNRDGRVNLADIAIARTNQSGFSSIGLITPTSSSAAASSKALPLAQSTASTSDLSPVSPSTIKLPTSELSTINLSSFAVDPTIEANATKESEREEAEQSNDLALLGASLDTEGTQHDGLDRAFETTGQENDSADSLQFTDIDSLFEADFSVDV